MNTTDATLVILLVGVTVGGREIVVSWGWDIREGGVVGVVVAVLDLEIYIQNTYLAVGTRYRPGLPVSSR